MRISKTVVIFHFVLSGIIAILVTVFFASGAIGENYTNSIFVAPIFFLIIVFWLAGVLFLVFKSYQTSIKMMWLSIPLGMLIAFPIAAVL
ncbi:hypothetical protein [Oceanobacillus sp. FSL H7-0719]|uniref:hypothetical protein n=1 Tax=Oceanobacillus sp. FSL H7-0719 TaxID=2954507 RepID=UPI003255C2D9